MPAEHQVAPTTHHTTTHNNTPHHLAKKLRRLTIQAEGREEDVSFFRFVARLS